MAGMPMRRINKAMQDAVTAVTEGREADAKRALLEARRTAEESGLPIPALPPEVAEMWVSVVQETLVPKRKDVRDLRLGEETRRLLMQTGEKSAERLHALMHDDTLWASPAVALRDKLALANLGLQRAYGGMPVGAQKVEAGQVGEVEEQLVEVGKTLSVMIRARQASKAEPRDVTPVDGEGEE